MLAFAALMIDINYIRMSALQAQNAADAAAHAATITLRGGGSESEAQSIGEAVVNLNTIAGTSVHSTSNTTFAFGGWDYDTRSFDPTASYTNAVQVTVRRRGGTNDGPLDLLVSPIFGMNSVNLAAVAISALRTREIMVVQDVTGSFSRDIDKARIGNLALLDYMYANQFPGDRVGMICFTGDTHYDANNDGVDDFESPWVPLTYVDTDYSSIYSVWSTLDWCDKDRTPDGTENGNDHMLDCRAGYDGTNQAAGLEDAVDHFLANGDPNALHFILLISDGLYSCWPNNNPNCDLGQRHDDAILMADYAEANDISVYSVSLNKSYSASQTAFLESLVRGYGSFYEANTGNELAAILDEIAEDIPIALVD
ncbi:MAG: hypothetical protein H6739_18935 [Alphaproteobacteria bacterium]|nr:hypothetical protein [Alphaproteobacteria bacterium]